MFSTLFKQAGVVIFIGAIIGTTMAAPQRLKWKKNTIEVGISTSLLDPGPNLPPQDETLAAIKRALESWESVTNLTFRTSVSTIQNVDPSGPHGDGVSLITMAATYENQSLFPKGGDDAAARTRVFYDGNGVITEADIVLNPFLQFSVNGNLGTFDLQATLTHELGHLLGLDHSDILGSTMGENNSKNGLFGLLGFSPRTLSISDISAIRGLYGSPPRDVNCCARIEGKLVANSGRGFAGWLVWVEDIDSGRVTASVRTRADGSFSMGGVETGNVRVMAQPLDPRGKSGLEPLGEYSLKRGITQPLNTQIKNRALGVELSYVGFQDQLAKSAVLLNSGYMYNVLVAGHLLDRNTITVRSTSPWIHVDQETIESANFGENVSALTFRVEVSRETPNGDYTLFVTTQDGATRALVGSLTVENYPNIASVGLSSN
jgi:hypothetical protein